MRPILDHDFVARGTLFRDNLSVPVTITGTYSDFEYKPVKCLVMPDDSKQNFQPFFDNYILKHLKGIAQDKEEILIPDLALISGTGTDYWEGIADPFIKGNLEEFDPTDGEISCELFIPPTPLAQTHGYICDSDGTISFENPKSERKGISWTTKYGNVQLIDRHFYAEHQVGINPGIVQIRCCQITFKTHPNNSISLAKILEDFAETFDDTLWLISLLSRKRLIWYTGDALFIPKDNVKSPFRSATIIRNLHLGYENAMGYGEHESDLLIAPDKLKTELFQELLNSYNISKYHDAIRRAIMYILMTYESTYFEAYIGIVYLALETLVSGLDVKKKNNKLLKPNVFRYLTGQLEQVIKKEVKEENIVTGLIENLQKINFVEYPSYTNKLLLLLKQYKVPIDRLWPPNTNVDAKLREIIGRRNQYIHKGEIGNIDENLYDIARLRTLVELWILKLLNCPDDAINPHYLTNLAPIERIESLVKLKN